MSKCEECKNNDSILSCTVNEQGEHHSFNDEPSLVFSSGTKFWHKNGYKHRENDLPATIHPDGDKYWFKDGEYHRTNGPARYWPNENIIKWFYEGNKIISVTKISETTFQYENQVGLILENIEDKIYLGLLGDEKKYIRFYYHWPLKTNNKQLPDTPGLFWFNKKVRYSYRYRFILPRKHSSISL